jgi:hypothetical protein
MDLLSLLSVTSFVLHRHLDVGLIWNGLYCLAFLLLVLMAVKRQFTITIPIILVGTFGFTIIIYLN